MVVVSGVQFVNKEGIEVVINDNVIKLVGNCKSIIKTFGSTIVDWGHTTWFCGWICLQIWQQYQTIVQFVAIEMGFDEAVANFHG